MDDTFVRTVDSDWYRQRLSGTLVVVLVAFLLLLGRLYYLQVIKGSEYRRQSENNCVRLQTVPPPRGLIYDRHGTVMVDNRPSFSVSIVLEDAEDPTAVLERLAGYLGEEPKAFTGKLEEARGWPSFKPIVLKRDLDRDAVAVLEAHKLDLPGVVIAIDTVRHYVEKERASHLIGYLSEISPEQLKSGRYPLNRQGDFVGKFGVEKSYEIYFHGEPGSRKVQVSALGQVTSVLETIDAFPGKNVYLTMDVNLQEKAEEMLAGKVGAVAVMDVSNGEILALASSPAYDPNAFVGGITTDRWKELLANEFHPMTNKAIQGQYPPGSTFKIVTAMAGLEEGVITEDTEFYCPGHYRYGNRTYRCWNKRGHGPVRLIKALAESCDVYFYQVGEKLGVDRLAKYSTAAGLGMRTGIELEHEVSGLVPSTNWKLKRFGVSWQAGETLSVAIGQGFNLVTPIQMVALTAAVANGGMRFKPTLVKAIVAPDGEPVPLPEPTPVGRLSASEKTLRLIREGLVNVVNTRSGTAWWARLEEVQFGGKTGTAQVVAMEEEFKSKPLEETPYRFRDHAWFVAFAPAEKPEIAIAVLVEHGGHGSSAAGPIAREIIRTYVTHSRSAS